MAVVQIAPYSNDLLLSMFQLSSSYTWHINQSLGKYWRALPSFPFVSTISFLFSAKAFTSFTIYCSHWCIKDTEDGEQCNKCIECHTQLKWCDWDLSKEMIKVPKNFSNLYLKDINYYIYMYPILDTRISFVQTPPLSRSAGDPPRILKRSGLERSG